MNRINWLIVTSIILLILACLPDAERVVSPPSRETAAPNIESPSPQKRWEDVLVKARQEGAVVLYGEIGPDLSSALGAAFQDRHGIKVEFVTGKAPEVVRKYLAERASNLHLADVFILGAPTSLLTVKPAGVLRPIEPALLLPEVTDLRSWANGQIPYLDKDHMILPLARGVIRGLIANSEQVRKDEISTFRDLLNPKWRGKITIFDPTITGSANNWVSFILFKAYGVEEGKEYLREFVRQEPIIMKDARLQVEWVAKGKYPLGVGPQAQTVANFIKLGAPLAMVRVNEGIQLRPGATVVSLPDKPAHPNSATIMVNWLLTAEGQKVFSQGFGLPPSRLGVSVEGLDPNTFPSPGEKILPYGEDDILRQGEALTIAKEIFAPLMK